MNASPPPQGEAHLMARLAELGIETETVRHPPLHTVEESRRLRGEMPGGHAKNLFLKDKKGQLWLVVAREDLRVDLNRLDRRIGAARLSFGRPELLAEALGVQPGSVTPFALINDDPANGSGGSGGRVRLVLDAGLLALDPLHFHPLDNRATTRIAAADLLRFVEATGHPPLILDLSAADASAPALL